MKILIIPFFLALLGTSETSSVNEDWAQELKAGLSQIYDEKSFRIGPIEIAEAGDLITISGKGKLHKEDITLNAGFSKERKLIYIESQFQSALKVNKKRFKKFSKGPAATDWFPKPIRKGLRIESLRLEFDSQKESLQRIQINNRFINAWSLFGSDKIQFRDLKGQLIIDDPKRKKVTNAKLSGNLKVSKGLLKASAARNKSGQDWVIQGSVATLSLNTILDGLQGGPLGLDVSLPKAVKEIRIKDATFSAYPNRKSFSLSGVSNLGKTELWIKPKNKSKDFMYMVGFAPNPQYRYADLMKELSIIDALKLSNSGLVLSSDASSETGLEVFKRLGASPKLNRGLNIVGAYDLKGVGLDKLLGLNSLTLRGVISNRAQDMLLEGSINTNIDFGEVASFKRLIFRLKPDPQKLEVSIGGELHVQVDKDLLKFEARAGIDAADQALFIEGNMDGNWNQPFGVNGMQLSDLWIRVGASFRTTPIPLPELGIAGKLKAGSLEGDMMVFLNLNNPSEAALDAGFNKISVGQVMRTFCNPKVEKNMSDDMNKLVNSIYLEDTRLTVVPKPMTINNTSYDGGFRIKGKGAVNGIGAFLDLNIDYNNGIQAKAEVDPIRLDPYFSLTGAAGKKKPFLH